MKGNPYDGSFVVNWQKIEGLDGGTRPSWNDGRFGEVANLAASVQSNLEASALSLLSSLRDGTGQVNVCLTGGVALNSVLNGRVVREGGWEQVCFGLRTVLWVGVCFVGWTCHPSAFCPPLLPPLASQEPLPSPPPVPPYPPLPTPPLPTPH